MAGINKINLMDSFQLLTDYFAPKIIGEVNDVFVKIARIKGEDIPWHNHKDEDELFYIVEGSLLFEIEGQESFTMNEGDIFIVGRGINHRVSSSEECKIMLIENKSTAHTGEVITEITRGIDEQLNNV
jgi:quercetin dioxygenase-like cupin family protein